MKLIISAVLLIPLGLAMGMPFPTGLRALAENADPSGAPSSSLPSRQDGDVTSHPDNSIEWAWAMNAASSVLGSVLAIMIAIEFGLNITLACGAAAYAFALLFHGRLRSTFSVH